MNITVLNMKKIFLLVTFAASAIFAYWWIVPTLLYMLLWKRGSQAGYTFLEIICVYGYSLAIYIPISVSGAHTYLSLLINVSGAHVIFYTFPEYIVKHGLF